jgi:hypothetical protein
MELWPPDLSEHDEQEQSSDEPRGYWVSEVLGDDWKSEGDGIYRYMPGSDERPSRDPEPALVWVLECGHEVPVLEDEQPDEPPRRPRLCLVCGKLRKVTVDEG